MRLSLKRVLPLVLAFIAYTGQVESKNAEPVPAPLETVVTMQVDGSVTIDPQGKVEQYSVDTNLPGPLRENLDRTVRSWKFNPVIVEGTPRRALARMRVTLSASKEGEVYRVAVDNVTFPVDPKLKTTRTDADLLQISGKKLLPPGYPMGLAQQGVSGAVLLAVDVGPDGRASRVLAVQSMLYDVRGRDTVLRQAIKQFESVAVSAAKRWSFNVPATDKPRTASERTVMVPVQFVMSNDAGEAVGTWRTVVRQPKRAIEWLPAMPARQLVGIADTEGTGVIPLDGGAVSLAADVAGSVVM